MYIYVYTYIYIYIYMYTYAQAVPPEVRQRGPERCSVQGGLEKSN